MKHLLSIESLSADEILAILDLTAEMKATRGRHASHPLRHTCWGFEVGIRELGGDPLFLNANDLQLGRGEPIEDTARVLGRMLHGAVIRTYAQSDLETFARMSGLPTINALTDGEHPCQILADLFTIQERLGDWRGRHVCYLGDGACNVPNSWLWAAARLGFSLTICAPPGYQPSPELLAQLGAGASIRCVEDPRQAVRDADVLYTDVWVSMGLEAEADRRLCDLRAYQVNAELVALARPGAMVLHCLPAYRGKEITADVLEKHADAIFDQAENRLHAQKAVLSLLSAR